MRTQYTHALEPLFTQIKIGVFGGLFLSFPVLATQIYKFVAPGLYKNERDAFRPTSSRRRCSSCWARSSSISWRCRS